MSKTQKILSSNKSSELNLSCFFDIIKPRRKENLQSILSDPVFSLNSNVTFLRACQSTFCTLVSDDNEDNDSSKNHSFVKFNF